MIFPIFNLIRHRFVRIWQSYFPKVLSPGEHEILKTRLDPELLSIFYSQPLCDQRHGLLVYERCKVIFSKIENKEYAPTDQELFLSSLFHDVAKKFCNFSVTQRVAFATLLLLIPNSNYETLRNSKCKILRRIGIYVDHAQLSYDVIESVIDSEFVKIVTLGHHGSKREAELSEVALKQIELFIEADTL